MANQAHLRSQTEGDQFTLEGRVRVHMLRDACSGQDSSATCTRRFLYCKEHIVQDCIEGG